MAQFSVVSVGLQCEQMILTRFVKNEDPVIMKIPGYSSLQVQSTYLHYISNKTGQKFKSFQY